MNQDSKPPEKDETATAASLAATVLNGPQPTATESVPTQDPPLDSTKNNAPARKHILDWVLGFFSLISLLLNIYLLYEKKLETRIQQPGPAISHVLMPARDALILVGLKERRDLFFSHFPNPSFLRSNEWITALAKPPATALDLRDTQWRFLTVQNFTETIYENVRIQRGQSVLAVLGRLDPKNTVFVYVPAPNSFGDADVTFEVRGSNHRSRIPLPRVGANEVSIIAELAVTKLGSLEGVDDRTRALIRAKNTALKMVP